MTGAVNVTGEPNAIVINLCELGSLTRLARSAQSVTRLIWKHAHLLANAVFDAETEAEHLVAAAIRKNWAIPGHELMESPELRYELRSRTQVEVVSVREDCISASIQ
jgi:hypothetical protein